MTGLDPLMPPAFQSGKWSAPTPTNMILLCGGEWGAGGGQQSQAVSPAVVATPVGEGEAGAMLAAEPRPSEWAWGWGLPAAATEDLWA